MLRRVSIEPTGPMPEIDGNTGTFPEAEQARHARRFLIGFTLTCVVVLATFFAFEVVLPNRIFMGTPLSRGEATQLQDTLGLVEKIMRSEEEIHGARVIREWEPKTIGGDPPGQRITYTVIPQDGSPTRIYRVRYALMANPDPKEDRDVVIYALNPDAEKLLAGLGVKYVKEPDAANK